MYPKYSLMDQLLYFASLYGVPKQEAKRRIETLAQKLEVEEYLYPERTRGKGGRAGRERKGRRRSLSWRSSFPRETSRKFSLWRRFYPIRSF